MKKFIFALSLMTIFLIGCSSTPKGEYSRSKIERPYALPDDVAKSSLGVVATSTVINDPSDSATGEKEEETESAPFAVIEHGISKNVSWVYPIGVRWEVWNRNEHTVGISAATLIFVSALSFDYWYRFNSELSLRPFYRSYSIDYIFVEESQQVFGAEFLYQATPVLALGFYGSKGKFETSSDLIDAIVTGVSGDDDFSSKVEGDLTTIGLNLTYSISELWDFDATYEYAKYTTDDFDLDGGTLRAFGTYYW